jgi:hypothetical protein
MRIDQLHDELCEALFAAGADRPEALLPKGYNDQKADAVFSQRRIIVEVKSLCSDRVEAAEVEGVVDEIMSEWMRNGGPVTFGTVSYDVSKLPDQYARKLISYYGNRIRRELNKASGQIRDTASGLGWSERPFGIVAFITPSSFRTHAGVIGRAAWDLLKRTDQAPYVDAIMTFAVPVEDHGTDNMREMLVVPHPRGEASIPAGLARHIADTWALHYTNKVGSRLLARQNFSVDQFMEKFMAPERPTQES